MKLSTTLRLTPAPSMKGILSAGVMLYVYVLTARAQPALFGRMADPVTLAVTARMALALAENAAGWPRFLRNFRRFAGAVLGTFALPFVMIALMLWANSPAVAMAVWSAQLALTGASGVVLALFGTPSMKYIPSGFPKTHAASKPIHLFLSGSLLLQALIAAVLALMGNALIWVAYASAGWVLQLWLTNWLAMLWLIAHERNAG